MAQWIEKDTYPLEKQTIVLPVSCWVVWHLLSHCMYAVCTDWVCHLGKWILLSIFIWTVFKHFWSSQLQVDNILTTQCESFPMWYVTLFLFTPSGRGRETKDIRASYSSYSTSTVVHSWNRTRTGERGIEQHWIMQACKVQASYVPKVAWVNPNCVMGWSYKGIKSDWRRRNCRKS